MEKGLYQERNLTMLADFYEFTMANGYLESGAGDCDVVFDLFFRRIPDAGGFAICAGLEQVVQYLQNLRFTQEDLDYFRGRGCFGESSSGTSETSASPAMCGGCRRVPPSSPTSRC